jgi:hypothetical protein
MLIVKITTVGGSENKTQRKNTAADDCEAMLRVKCVLFQSVNVSD